MNTSTTTTTTTTPTHDTLMATIHSVHDHHTYTFLRSHDLPSSVVLTRINSLRAGGFQLDRH
ncbi:hypothetical protein K440DRAFT_619958 [Wilcoxina mikolae CBS 423.85]|nr:hypothetical protein K440DRAFT_619958 [Wilcoxina mikolae CBS 423.85]